jgi:hypothetical protein
MRLFEVLIPVQTDSSELNQNRYLFDLYIPTKHPTWSFTLLNQPVRNIQKGIVNP